MKESIHELLGYLFRWLTKNKNNDEVSKINN